MGYQKSQISRIHRGTFKIESHEPSCRIILKIQDHAANTLFHRDNRFFLKFTEDKVSLIPGQKAFSFIGRGGIIWDREGTFSKTIDRGSHRGTWTRCINAAVNRFNISYRDIIKRTISCFISQKKLLKKLHERKKFVLQD